MKHDVDEKRAGQDSKNSEKPMSPEQKLAARTAAFKRFFYAQRIEFVQDSPEVDRSLLEERVQSQQGSLIICLESHTGASLIYLNIHRVPKTLPLNAQQYQEFKKKAGQDAWIEQLEMIYAAAAESDAALRPRDQKQDQKHELPSDSFLPDFYFPSFDLKAATLTVLIGATGAGKSTLINYLLGADMRPDRQMDDVTYRDPIQQYCQTSALGSCTTSAKVYQFEDDYYCDVPGFLDDRGEIMSQMAGSAVDFLIQSAKAVKLVLVIEEASAIASRGELLKKTIDAAKHYDYLMAQAPARSKVITVINKSRVPDLQFIKKKMKQAKEQIARRRTQNQQEKNSKQEALQVIESKIDKFNNPGLLQKMRNYRAGYLEEKKMRKKSLEERIQVLDSELRDDIQRDAFLQLLLSNPIVIADVRHPPGQLRHQIRRLTPLRPSPSFFMEQAKHVFFAQGTLFQQSISKLQNLTTSRAAQQEVERDVKVQELQRHSLTTEVRDFEAAIGLLDSNAKKNLLPDASVPSAPSAHSAEGLKEEVSDLKAQVSPRTSVDELIVTTLDLCRKDEKSAKEDYEAKATRRDNALDRQNRILAHLKSVLDASQAPILTMLTLNDHRDFKGFFGGYLGRTVRRLLNRGNDSIQISKHPEYKSIEHTGYEIASISESKESKKTVTHSTISDDKENLPGFSQDEMPTGAYYDFLSANLNAAQKSPLNSILKKNENSWSKYKELTGPLTPQFDDFPYEIKLQFEYGGLQKNLPAVKSDVRELEAAWSAHQKACEETDLAQERYLTLKAKRELLEKDKGRYAASLADLEKSLSERQDRLTELNRALSTNTTLFNELTTQIAVLEKELHSPSSLLWFRLVNTFLSVYKDQYNAKIMHEGGAYRDQVTSVSNLFLEQVKSEVAKRLGIQVLPQARGCIRPIPGSPPVTPDPAPVTPDPAPVTPDPAPVTPDPAPVTSDPAPVTSDPAPVIPNSVSTTAFDEKAPSVIHQPCQKPVDLYYYFMAVLLKSAACPHPRCEEKITEANLAVSLTKEQLAVITQFLSTSPEATDNPAVDPYGAVRHALKEAQGDEKSVSGSLPALLQSFASRLGAGVDASNVTFYSTLWALFLKDIAKVSNQQVDTQEFLGYATGKMGERLLAGTECRLSDYSHRFYTQELQVLANLFALHITVIADGREPLIISPHSATKENQAATEESTEATDETEIAEPAYLVLYYESQEESFSYRRLAFSPDVELSDLLSRIAGVPFMVSEPSKNSAPAETDRRSSWVPSVDSVGEPEPPAIPVEGGAVVGASVPREQSDLSEGREAKLAAERAALTLTREEIIDDGNCFFAAVVAALRAYNLPNRPVTQQAVRDAIVDWASGLSPDSPLLEGRTLAEYQAAVGTNLWGGELEFQAVAEIYGVPLVMLISGNRPALYRPQSEKSAGLTQPAMLIEYTDHHYNVLRLSDPSQSGAWFYQIQGQPVPDLTVWLNASDLLAPRDELDYVMLPQPGEVNGVPEPLGVVSQGSLFARNPSSVQPEPEVLEAGALAAMPQ